MIPKGEILALLTEHNGEGLITYESGHRVSYIVALKKQFDSSRVTVALQEHSGPSSVILALNKHPDKSSVIFALSVSYETLRSETSGMILDSIALCFKQTIGSDIKHDHALNFLDVVQLTSSISVSRERCQHSCAGTMRNPIFRALCQSSGVYPVRMPI